VELTLEGVSFYDANPPQAATLSIAVFDALRPTAIFTFLSAYTILSIFQEDDVITLGFVLFSLR